ncbi:MAG: hypothetical protein M1819_007316 [Sarea resinae]|nr:MAG: hypothetical protein M1819_007316 [Sarea resinae]
MFGKIFSRANSRSFTIDSSARGRSTTLSSRAINPLRISRAIPRAREYTTTAAARKLWKKYPFSVSLAAFCICAGAGSLLYTNYIYNTYILGTFHNFPEPVAQKLRRALYFTNISLSPRDAVKYYRQALAVADELGMDPFSDEILGVKIQLAALLERVQQYRKAIDVLEIVRRDCLAWVELLGDKEGNEGKRTRVLGKTVGISVKLGELYAGEYVQDREAAEERLVWAVETVLREKQRREKEGVKEGEGDWMTDEEIGGALESLAHHYEEKNQHYLAAPLFLQALALAPPKSCHAVVLMNNLSISLAQQTASSPSSTTPPSSTIEQTNLASATAWATKALTLSAAIPADQKTEECDVGCAVAMHNLGEFAERAGKPDEARRWYGDARKTAQACGFQEGVLMAEEGRKRVAA